MIGKVNPQENFFDNEIFSRISEKNILVRIKKVINFDSIAERIESYYDREQGRPSWPLKTMIAVLFIEIFYNLSDREIERQIRHNFLYRWFSDLSFYDREPDATSLVIFRSRIGEEGARELFDEIVRQAKEAGVLVGKVKAVDATHIEANAAKVNVVNFLRQARKKILRIFKKEKPHEAKRIEKEYIDKEKTYQKSTDEEIKGEVKKTQAFVMRLRGFCVDKIEGWLDLLWETMEKILRKKANRCYSFVDPDARWGHKTKEKTFFGYKAQTVQDESRIVTSLEVLPGNRNEGARLIPILKEDKRKGIDGTGAVADKLYDSIDNRKGVRGLGLIPYILSRTSKRKADSFFYNVEEDVFTCKAGKHPIGKSQQEKGYLHYFSVRDCKSCPHRKDCIGTGIRQRVYISDCECNRLLTGKAVTRMEAKKIRSTIEPKYGEAKVWHGYRRARYRGRCRVAIQTFITFGVMNAKRLVRLLEKKEKGLCRT
jgi:IS5 family transposase